MRALVRWGREGAASWLSHLDIQRAMQRALRRSGIDHAWSQGFNPHALLSFASALPVGMASDYEVMDIGFDGPAREGVLERLSAALPPGFFARELRWVEDGFPSPMATVWAADIEITGAPELADAAARFLALDAYEAEIHSKKGAKRLDIRPLVLGAEADGEVLRLRLRHGSTGSVKPEAATSALFALAGLTPRPLTMKRALLLDAQLRPLMEAEA